MGIPLGELAERLGAELRGDPELRVERVATLPSAGPGAISFLSNRHYRRYLPQTKASAVILGPEDAPACPVPSVVVADPYLGYARAAAMLNPAPAFEGGVHDSAWVSPGARVDSSAWIGANSVVEAAARVDAGTFVGPCSVIGEAVHLGADSRLVASVTLCRGVVVGRRALVHPGVVIGADGFGIANDAGVWVKIPQLGGVRIGDDVEIGANTTIDRGALEDTIIENGVKLDNQVQIGHNVHIGAHTAVAGCVAVAGSTRIGSRCTIGGASAIAGHLEIGDDVHLAGGSSVPGSIPRPGTYASGIPVLESRLWRRNMVRFKHLDALARRLRALERRLGVDRDGGPGDSDE